MARRARRPILAAAVVAPVTAASLFVAGLGSPSGGGEGAPAPTTTAAPDPVDDSSTRAVASNRVLPVDATDLEIVHQPLPPDGGLHSVVVTVRNRSDVVILASQLAIAIDTDNGRIDPLDAVFADRLLAAGGSTTVTVRAEVPAAGTPRLLVLYDGEVIAGVDLV